MPRELSVIAPAWPAVSAALPDAARGWRGHWPHDDLDRTVLALAGLLPPDSDGRFPAELPALLPAQPAAAWAGVYAAEPERIATLWPQAVRVNSLDELLSQWPEASRGQSRRENRDWLLSLLGLNAVATGDWLAPCFDAIRRRQLDWLSVYPGNGEVWQWNRARLRRWWPRRNSPRVSGRPAPEPA